MRIGIDVQQLTSSAQTGLYYYERHLLGGLRAIATRDRILLFVRYTHEWKEHEAILESRVGSLGFAVHWYGVTKAPYRLRERLNAIHRVSVFLHLTNPAFPVDNRRCHVFLIPDLTTYHAPQHHEDPIRRTWSDYFEQVRNHADMVLTFSEHTKTDVVKTLGVTADRVRAIPLAAGPEFRPSPSGDHARLEVLLKQWGLDRGNYILSVGTLEPRKNHGLILEAYARLRSQSRVPTGCKLVFAGGRGWLYESILSRIKELGLREEVRLLGHADPLEDLYRGAVLMVYPSLMEGFGLPPLEAMACGTPVIISNTSSLPEVVGDAGLMVDPSDVDGLADAMARILDDPGLRDELSAKGLRRASMFSWERTAASTVAALHEAHRLWRAE